MVVRKAASDFFGTRWGAHCHFSPEFWIKNPALTNALIYLFRNYLCFVGFRFTFAFKGFVVWLILIDIGGIRAGSLFPDLIKKDSFVLLHNLRQSSGILLWDAFIFLLLDPFFKLDVQLFLNIQNNDILPLPVWMQLSVSCLLLFSFQLFLSVIGPCLSHASSSKSLFLIHSFPSRGLFIMRISVALLLVIYVIWRRMRAVPCMIFSSQSTSASYSHKIFCPPEAPKTLGCLSFLGSACISASFNAFHILTGT